MLPHISLFKVVEQVDSATARTQQKSGLIHVSERFGLVFMKPSGRITGQWCWQHVDHLTIKDRSSHRVNITHQLCNLGQRKKKFVFAGSVVMMDSFFDTVESCVNAYIEQSFLFWKKKCILKGPRSSTRLPANVTNLTQIIRLLEEDAEVVAIPEYERQQESSTILGSNVPTEAQQGN